MEGSYDYNPLTNHVYAQGIVVIAEEMRAYRKEQNELTWAALLFIGALSYGAYKFGYQMGRNDKQKV
jgi:hypothetical protein